MRRRTLAGRVSRLQLLLTLLALAAVSVVTPVALRVLLEQKTDAMLKQTIAHVSQLADQVPVAKMNPAWMHGEIEEVRPSDVRVELLDSEGRTLAENGSGPSFLMETTGCEGRGLFRVCARKASAYVVIASADQSADRAAQQRLIGALIAVAGLAGALVVLVSVRASRRALAPLTDLGVRIAAIVPGTDARLGAASEFEELESLRARFDDLIARYDEALRRERRLAAQASHELRTPLGVARAEVEALTDGPELASGKARALAALDRLSELIETLLWFARAQARLDIERMEVVNLADVLRAQITERTRSYPALVFRGDLPDEALVRGDEALLGRVTANLLDNAIKYGDKQCVEVRAQRHGDRLEVWVSNTGQPPAAELRERLFEPFFRDLRAAPSATGFGLGLPFARAVARAHGGDVELVETTDDTTRFVLALPLIEWSERG